MRSGRDAAWDAVHEALPARWNVGPVSYDPGRSTWVVTAIDTRTTGRGKLPQTVSGYGEDEVAALRISTISSAASRSRTGRAKTRSSTAAAPTSRARRNRHTVSLRRGLTADEIEAIVRG